MSKSPKECRAEVNEFIESIESDFYLDLHLYSHYPHKEFNTSSLSITTILKICESHHLNTNASRVIHNVLDTRMMLDVVLYRIESCGNKRVAAKTRRVVEDMECYLSTFTPNITGVDMGAKEGDKLVIRDIPLESKADLEAGTEREVKYSAFI